MGKGKSKLVRLLYGRESSGYPSSLTGEEYVLACDVISSHHRRFVYREKMAHPNTWLRRNDTCWLFVNLLVFHLDNSKVESISWI